jgi:hypothetical protein
VTTTQLIIIIAIVMVLVIAVSWGRGGPRVTQITRTVHRDADEKDRDDA